MEMKMFNLQGAELKHNPKAQVKILILLNFIAATQNGTK